MADNIEPIYDFDALKQFLKRRGYKIGTRSAYEPFTPEDVEAVDVTNGKMSFEADGIFVLGDDNVKRQVFLYKKDYHLDRYGKPRFHICKCNIIQEFINSGGFNAHYVRANSEPVPVKDLDNFYRIKQISELPLCNYCKRMYIGQYISDSSEFVELLKSANENQTEELQDVELDLFGYTRDWDEISKAYREEHQYTCEKCGLKIEDTYDRQYIHVHHIDKNKLNNRKDNLQCLCLRCHSQVDDVHRKNLTTGANRIIFEAFEETYPEN